MGAGGRQGLHESKALLGGFYQICTNFQRPTHRKENVLQLKLVAEPSFLNELKCVFAGGSFKGKGCHNRKYDIQMQAAWTGTAANKIFSSCDCGLRKGPCCSEDSVAGPADAECWKCTRILH